MSSATLTKIFLAVSILGSTLTIARIIGSGLARRYRAFCIFFLFRIIDLLYPLFLNPRSNLYAWVWVCTEPVQRILCVLAVVELYRLILEQYRGLYSLGRWVLYLSSGVAVLISIASLLPHITPSMPQKSRYLGYVFAFNRGVDLSLVIIIIVMLLFLSRFPVTLSRNVLVHAGLYSVFFLSSSMYLLLGTVLGLKARTEVNLIFFGVTAACTVAWFFLLTPAGERVKASRFKFSPEYERRALGQLDALNQVLLRSSKG